MNIAFIPVRGGSKSIPLKNIKILNGKPLVYWTLKAANELNRTWIGIDISELAIRVSKSRLYNLNIYSNNKDPYSYIEL